MKDLLLKASEPARRSFIQGTAATALGVSLPAINLTEAHAAKSKGGSSAKADSVIYIFLGGGMSHTDTFDIKTNSGTSVGFTPINTSARGVKISNLLPNMAKQMNHVSLVRSMSSKIGDHEKATYFTRTSYEKRSTITHPHMGAWTSSMRPGQNRTLPNYVKIGSGGSGRGFLESTHSAVPILDPRRGVPNTKRKHNVTASEFDRRLMELQRINKSFNVKYKKDAITANTNAYQAALSLMKSKDLAAFDINQEKEDVKKAYGSTKFGQACLLARRLVESGIRYIDVNFGGWDHHADIKNVLPPKAGELDKVLAALISDLNKRGLLKRTLVVVATEFGRKPNLDPTAGRSHHPAAYTSILAGAGVKGGYVHGKTDERGQSVTDGKVAVADFNATIANIMGLDVNQVIMAPNGRPFQVAHKGQPIKQVLS